MITRFTQLACVLVKIIITDELTDMDHQKTPPEQTREHHEEASVLDKSTQVPVVPFKWVKSHSVNFHNHLTLGYNTG